MKYIKDIFNFTETLAPVETAMDFDNCGLLVGNMETPVSKALVTLDITTEVVREATETGAQLIISHHPIIFQPVKRIESGALYSLIKNGLSALCLHTNLDLSPIFGVNTCLAEAVGVKNGMFAEGECLYIGELEKEMTAKEFAATVKAALSCKGLRYTKAKDTVKTVAMCSGSGGDYVRLAKEYNADVLLTGEIKHHEILEAEEIGISIVEAGHFETENIVVKPLCNLLNKQFPDVEFVPSQKNKSTIQYL